MKPFSCRIRQCKVVSDISDDYCNGRKKPTDVTLLAFFDSYNQGLKNGTKRNGKTENFQKRNGTEENYNIKKRNETESHSKRNETK
jgi:hypothetical protein